MIVWDAPGPYAVAFTTREGGVSTGPFASLNIGSRDDDPTRVAENRRIACAELGLDADRLAVNRQRHSATVNRARSAARHEDGDALWTDEPNLPMLAMSADCVPIAIATTHGPPTLAVIHAGWRGLAAGIIAETVQALEGRPAAAVIGPAAGPCCYQVGAEVSEQFDSDLTSPDGILDLWQASARALGRAGVDRVDSIDLCTRCNPDQFFSFRRSGAPHGLQGVIGALRA